MDHFFSTMDRDFDGRLSFAEIMGEETPIERLFNMMDKNGDGFVSKKVSLISFFHRFAFFSPFMIMADLTFFIRHPAQS